MIGMKHGNELVEHHLTIENLYPDDEFNDDNVFVRNVKFATFN